MRSFELKFPSKTQKTFSLIRIHGGAAARCVRVLFTREGKLEQEIERWIGISGDTVAICCGEERPESESEAALTCGHELWAVTERMRLQIKAAEMSFLRRVSGLSRRDMAPVYAGGARRGATTPPHQEEPAEVFSASDASCSAHT